MEEVRDCQFVFVLRPGTIITHTGHLETLAHVKKRGPGPWLSLAWRESGRLNEGASSPDQEDPGKPVQPEAALLENTLVLNM